MINKLRVVTRPLLVASFLLAPFAAHAASFQINAACVMGTCPPTDSISFGGTSAGSFSFATTVNGDPYSVSGTYSNSYGAAGSHLFVDPVVTYTGAGPTAQADVLTFDMLQNIFDNSPGTFDGTYSEHVPLSLSAGAGSTVSGQVLWDGKGVGVVGPFGPGVNSGDKSALLTGLTGDTLSGDYQFIFDFAAGTQPGASGSSPAATPEPAQTIPLALGLAATAFGALRRRSIRNSRAGA